MEQPCLILGHAVDARDVLLLSRCGDLLGLKWHGDREKYSITFQAVLDIELMTTERWQTLGDR
jgi:hypothetical protein